MINRILRVAGVELYKLRRRRGVLVFGLLILLAMIGRAAYTAIDVEAQRDRTRELNAWLIFANASDTGLFVASLLLLLYASVAFAGEATLGTLKGVLIRPVSRVDLLLGKLTALLATAFLVTAGVLLAAAAAGAILSDYEGVKTVSHHEREIGLIAAAHEPADPTWGDRADLRRLGFTGRWERSLRALRVDHVIPGSLAESRQIQPGDVVTHAAAGSAPYLRLTSIRQWQRWNSDLKEGDDLRLKMDSPIVAPNPDFTRHYLAGQALRAIGILPLPLIALLCFGLLWSTLVDSTGQAVGGALLSYLALRYMAGTLIVSMARMAGVWSIFKENVDRLLFMTWLDFPMARLQGAATATANKELLVRDTRLAWAVCASTSILCLAFALWRFRKKDVL
jgi:ABC-type transport system involved in multi-copper enzyme maturation permease subunit